MTTNRTVAEFRAERRSVPPYRFQTEPREQPPWMKREKDDGLFYLIVCCLVGAIFALIALAFYSSQREKQMREAWTNAPVNECRERGKKPIIARDQRGRIVGVSCP